MIKIFKIITLLMCFVFFLNCSQEDDKMTPIEETSPVVLDLTQIPYEKLSDYNFFKGELKNQEPVYGVLPYQPISQLFTDYAKKKRFIWMPKGSKMTFEGDHKLMSFPNKTILIKNFYYETMTNGNPTQILETRVMILKNGEWIFAEYQWNEQQTEAFLITQGAFKNISFTHNGQIITTNYRLPHNSECRICHKSGSNNVPIALKPQNLNFNYNYPDGSKNQLTRLIEFGYLENNLPQNITSVVDYSDTSKSLELRMRSYLDINCGHCHVNLGDCDYRSIRLSFFENHNPTNLGVCETPQEEIPSQTNIILPNNSGRSVMYYRMNSIQQNEMMPKVGRTIVHTEGLQLLEDYINSLTPCP